MKRTSFLGIGGIAVLVATGAVALHLRPPHPGAGSADGVPPAVGQAMVEPAAPKPSPQASATAPSFDVVRVTPQGGTVIAGRAAPGAEVTVLDHDREVGHATADPRGEWVVAPTEPLPPGSSELHLSARSPGNGGTEVSPGVVAVLVPDPKTPVEVGTSMPAAPPGPAAVLPPREGEGATRALRQPPAGLAGGKGVLTVQPGNSLWRLARHSYGAGFRYVEIYQANQHRIFDPDLIYPGQILTMPGRR